MRVARVPDEHEACQDLGNGADRLERVIEKEHYATQAEQELGRSCSDRHRGGTMGTQHPMQVEIAEKSLRVGKVL